MNVVSPFPHVYLFRRISDNSPVYVGQQGGDSTYGSEWKYYITSSKILVANLREWGKKKFWEYYSKEIVKTIDILNPHRLNVVETLYMSHYDTYQNGYNLTEIGGSTRGLRRTEKEKEHIRQIHTGKVLSEETKKKISDTRSGYKYDTVTCPHCGRECGVNTVYRYHFDNCTVFTGRQRVGPKTGPHKKVECTHCNTLTSPGNFKRWHGDSCKSSPDGAKNRHINTGQPTYLVTTPFRSKPFNGYVEASKTTNTLLDNIIYRCRSSRLKWGGWSESKIIR